MYMIPFTVCDSQWFFFLLIVCALVSHLVVLYIRMCLTVPCACLFTYFAVFTPVECMYTVYVLYGLAVRI